MGRVHDAIDDRLRAFLDAQHIFFVATAPLAADGHVNLSPKGLDGSFAVVDPDTVAYLDLTGSGVETMAHLQENGRITIMFCAFSGPPRVVRLHGTGTVHLPHSARFEELLPVMTPRPGMRSIVEVRVDRVSDSCGFGVPFMDYAGDRDQLIGWAERKGDEGIAEYWATTNATSIDGLPGVPA